jgi:hypothetical protein
MYPYNRKLEKHLKNHKPFSFLIEPYNTWCITSLISLHDMHFETTKVRNNNPNYVILREIIILQHFWNHELFSSYKLQFTFNIWYSNLYRSKIKWKVFMQIYFNWEWIFFHLQGLIPSIKERHKTVIVHKLLICIIAVNILSH